MSDLSGGTTSNQTEDSTFFAIPSAVKVEVKEEIMEEVEEIDIMVKEEVEREVKEEIMEEVKIEVDEEIGEIPETVNIPHEQRPTPAPIAAATAADAAAAPSFLDLDAPPSQIDKDYWNSSSNGLFTSCPRGCYNTTLSSEIRSKHYKRYHYNIFYALVNKSWTDLERWINVQFGEVKSTRVCVRCAGIDPKYWGGFPKLFENRLELAEHIRSAHPNDFLSLSRQYYTMVTGKIIPDFDVHRILKDFMQKIRTVYLVADSSPAAAGRAVVPSAAAAPITPRSPYRVDEEYWNGKPASAVCPRGCDFFADDCTERRNHYKQHHHNIYYVMVSLPWSELERWMHIQFGKKNLEARVCVRCVDTPLNGIYHQTRVDLVKHIQSSHPSEFATLSRDYCNMVVGQKIPDALVHEILILINTVTIDE